METERDVALVAPSVFGVATSHALWRKQVKREGERERVREREQGKDNAKNKEGCQATSKKDREIDKQREQYGKGERGLAAGSFSVGCLNLHLALARPFV